LDKILIIGSGFSAALVKAYCERSSVRIFSPSLSENDNLSETTQDKFSNFQKLFSEEIDPRVRGRGFAHQ
jgi:hypothetical protein